MGCPPYERLSPTIMGISINTGRRSEPKSKRPNLISLLIPYSRTRASNPIQTRPKQPWSAKCDKARTGRNLERPYEVDSPNLGPPLKTSANRAGKYSESVSSHGLRSPDLPCTVRVVAYLYGILSPEKAFLYKARQGQGMRARHRLECWLETPSDDYSLTIQHT